MTHDAGGWKRCEVAKPLTQSLPMKKLEGGNLFEYRRAAMARDTDKRR
jgi:hypothetical protein